MHAFLSNLADRKTNAFTFSVSEMTYNVLWDVKPYCYTIRKDRPTGAVVLVEMWQCTLYIIVNDLLKILINYFLLCI